MGWLFFRKPDNVKRWFEDLLTHDGETFSQKVLASSVSISEAYAAVEWINKATGERDVVAATFLLRHIRGDDPHNFGYKDMDETMGPGIGNCPARILDLLTEPKNAYARRWRTECRARLARRAALRGIKAGDLVILPRRLNFGDMGNHRLFVYQGRQPTRRGNIECFRPVSYDGLDADLPAGRALGLVRISKWRDRDGLNIRPGNQLAETVATAAAEDSRRRAWETVLTDGVLMALPPRAYDLWLDAEAANAANSEYHLGFLLRQAGLENDAVQATVETVHQDIQDGARGPVRDVLAAHWTPEQAAAWLADHQPRAEQAAVMFAAEPGLEPPAPVLEQTPVVAGHREIDHQFQAPAMGGF